MLWILCVAISLGILTCANYIKGYIRYRVLISNIPGPKQVPFFGHIFELICDDATLFQKLRKWSQNHLPAYILSAFYFASVNISGPEEFELVASSLKNIQKAPSYLFTERWLGEGLLTSTGSKWQTRRKILTPAFHFGLLEEFVKVFNEETYKLVEILKTMDGSCVNIVPVISQFTLNTIAETAMGTAIDLKNESHKNFVTATQKIGKIFYYRLMRPWIYLHVIFYNLSPMGYLEKGLLKTLHNFTRNIIDKRSQNFVKLDGEEYNYSEKKKLAMLDILLNAKVGEGLIDDKGIEDEVNTFMFEGHDTTSTSICFTLMLLANHKDVQDLVYQEIIQVLNRSSEYPRFNKLNELKYMERVIKESLRLYPSVPFIARTLEEEITTKQGLIFPKEAIVHIHIFDIHRNAEYWPEPEKFDPDRFLLENCAKRHPFSFVPFSAGPRNCIGQRFAILEIKAVLCGILQNFILEPLDTPDNIVLVPDIILRTANETLRVKFLPRD